MDDKFSLVDDSVHLPQEDPPSYTASIGLEPTAPRSVDSDAASLGLGPSTASNSKLDAEGLPPGFLRELGSVHRSGAPPSLPHWEPASPTASTGRTPTIPQVSMGYDQSTASVQVVQPAATTTSPGNIAVTSASQTVVLGTPEVAPPSYFWLSCLVYWFCNIFAGSFAMVFSMVSANAAYANRMEDARRYSRYALVTSLCGMALGIVAVVLIAKLWLDNK